MKREGDKVENSLALNIFQKGFNFSQDGPGNRLVYHLQCCNFRCPWCSNPEGMPAVSDKMKTVPVVGLLHEAEGCRPLFFGGGGVTFTGGECTLQHDALLEALRLLKGAGIGTAIETNATDERLDELLPFVDFLIADLKQPDAALHKKLVGADNRAVLDNLTYIFNSGRQVLVRIPLVNGVNTDPEPFVGFLSKHDTSNAQFEILTYHEFGKEKWTEPYTVENGFVSDEAAAYFRRELEKHGLKIIST